ncbi:hypothetical protein [Tengunoibacter tsumagoiensis]|nr:hypothetical protein [Tengunoibacter tsumagoiensis]
MQDERQTCTVYVDYENLVESLSHRHSFDIATLLNLVLQRARQDFRIQRINIFGNWALYNLPEQIDRTGIVYRFGGDPGGDAAPEIEKSIQDVSVSKEGPQAYLLISGQAHYAKILKLLQQRQKISILWTLEPLNKPDRTLCSDYEPLSLPSSLQTSKWTRLLLLQGLVLVAARLTTPISLPDLVASLSLYPSFIEMIDVLLPLAFREHILLVSEDQDPLEGTQVSLNTQHIIVQEALLIEQRILNTAWILQAKQGWVAFSVMERAISTYSLLRNEQRHRHQWLELLIEEGRLLSEKRYREGRATTALSVGPVSEEISVTHEQNMTTLICVVDAVARRRQRGWISATQLYRDLGLHMTHAEARHIFEQATARQFLQLRTRPGNRDPDSEVTTVQLDLQQAQVRERLVQRNRLLIITYQLLIQRNQKIVKSLLLEEFMLNGQLSEHAARYWLSLLIQSEIIQSLVVQDGRGEYIISLNHHDPLVQEIELFEKRRLSEVQE